MKIPKPEMTPNNIITEKRQLTGGKTNLKPACILSKSMISKDYHCFVYT